MKKGVVLLMMAACFIPGAFLGCGDDNGTNSVSSELIGGWWFMTASMDGVPYASYSEIANTQNGDTSSITFYPDGSWLNYEYDNARSLIFMQGGTYSAHGDSLTMTTTERADVILDPPYVETAAYAISGNLLTMTDEVELGGTNHEIIIIYIKE